MKIGLFNNSSQTIEHKGFKFSGFDGRYHGMAIRKFGGDQCYAKISFRVGVGLNFVHENQPSSYIMNTTNHNYLNIM